MISEDERRIMLVIGGMHGIIAWCRRRCICILQSMYMFHTTCTAKTMREAGEKGLANIVVFDVVFFRRWRSRWICEYPNLRWWERGGVRRGMMLMCGEIGSRKQL